MTDMNDYDDIEESAVDEDEAQAAVKGAVVDDVAKSDIDVLEAETLTVTAKQRQREQLEDEIAAFLARGGKITEVPADESIKD